MAEPNPVEKRLKKIEKTLRDHSAAIDDLKRQDDRLERMLMSQVELLCSISQGIDKKVDDIHRMISALPCREKDDDQEDTDNGAGCGGNCQTAKLAMDPG